MSQRALTLPLRARVPQTPWVCKRCLATQVETVSGGQPAPLGGSRPTKDPSRVADYDATLPSSQREARLNKTDFYLKKHLPQRIPTQYLQHSTSPILCAPEREQREHDAEPHREIKGVVVSAGKMDKTVRVRVPGRRWNTKIGKFFDSFRQHLVHDPNNSCVVGDVVQLHRLHVSTQVFHVVGAITAPFGQPLSERPPVPTPDDRLAKYKAKRFAKLERRTLRVRAAAGEADAIQELRRMGLDPGKGVEPDKGQKANLQGGVGVKRNPSPGAILGNKGQKLPEGVLPGGKHEVGKIDARAKGNKKSAMKLNRKAEANILEAREKEGKLKRRGLEAESVLPRKSTVGEEGTVQ